MLDARSLLRAMNGIHEEDIIMAENRYFEAKHTKRFKTKRIVTLALAAALILSLSIVAYAVSTVNGPKAAEKVALEELQKWKEMGIISEELNVSGEATRVVEIKERTGSEYWYGRLFTHSYDVRWYGNDSKYFVNLGVDTITGKIKSATFEARADDTDEVVREIPALVDPTLPEEERGPEVYYFYQNYDDIFPADLTVDECCTMLAEYWGFTGYRLADTVDEAYYNAHWSAVEGGSLLKDMPTDNYYLTVFFEGDQEGVPMYLQLDQFPGRVCFTLGTGHLIG